MKKRKKSECNPEERGTGSEKTKKRKRSERKSLPKFHLGGKHGK